MIVKEPWLVVQTSTGRRTWCPDMKIDPMNPPFRGGHVNYKVLHQLVCTDCNVGVRAEDDHHCSDPD